MVKSPKKNCCYTLVNILEAVLKYSLVSGSTVLWYRYFPCVFIWLGSELQSFLKRTWPRAYSIWSAMILGSWPVCTPSSTTCPECTLEASSFEDTLSPCTQSPTASTSSQRQSPFLYWQKNKRSKLQDFLVIFYTVFSLCHLCISV